MTNQGFVSLTVKGFKCLFVYFSVVQCGLIDHSSTVRTITRNSDGKVLQLVMSDEFNVDNRNFEKGSDNLFESVLKPDLTNEALQFYNSSREYVTTQGGDLVITTRAIKTKWRAWDERKRKMITRTKNYTSGMVQSWNKFCFTGGVLEMSVKLPGTAFSGGLWPAAWLMGNLARGTFERSTMFVWPWSYDHCDEADDDSAPRQADTQEINACDPLPGYGLHPYQGRGAPEIDLFEAMPGHDMPGRTSIVPPFMSTSLQVSPGIPGFRRPVNGHALNASSTWYSNLSLGNTSSLNEWFWGAECGPERDPTGRHKYLEDAVSVNTDLDASHFSSHHTYRLEWQPGASGYLQWYLDGRLVLGIPGKSLQKATGALIPVEPMYLILNTALSHRWGMPEPCPVATCGACWTCYDCTNPECQCALPEGMQGCRNMPAEMRVDYIRLFQDGNDSSHTLGCSPKGFPTKKFIAGHIERYADWSQDVPPPSGHWRVKNWRQLLVIVLSPLLPLCLVLIWCARRFTHRVRQHNTVASSAPSLNSAASRFQLLGNSANRKGYSAIPDDGAEKGPSPLTAWINRQKVPGAQDVEMT